MKIEIKKDIGEHPAYHINMRGHDLSHVLFSITFIVSIHAPTRGATVAPIFIYATRN